MSLPSLTCGTSVDTSIHYYHSHEYGQDHGQEYHDQDNQQETLDRGHRGDEITYPCLFAILNCHQAFTNPEYWKTHVLSHFRTFEPPAIARCPFCLPSPLSSGSESGSGLMSGSASEPTSPGSEQSPSESGSGSGSGSEPTSPVSGSTSELDGTMGTFVNTPHTRAWDALLDHLVSHYQQQHHNLHLHQHHNRNQQGDPQTRHREQQYRTGKLDFELLRYLYTLRLITEEQWKAAVQLGVVPGSPADRRGEQSVRDRVGRADEPFWGLFSERRERQRARHGQDHGYGHGHGRGRGREGPGNRHSPGERRPGRIVLSSC